MAAASRCGMWWSWWPWVEDVSEGPVVTRRTGAAIGAAGPAAKMGDGPGSSIVETFDADAWAGAVTSG